jgi:hypothetical protein
MLDILQVIVEEWFIGGDPEPIDTVVAIHIDNFLSIDKF